MSKKAPKADLKKQLDVFSIVDDTQLHVFDRSTLEAWADCPWAAKENELHPRIMPEIAECGEQVHQACSSVVKEWISIDGQMSAGDIRNSLEQSLRGSRPDLQPQVIDAMIYSAWEWSKLVWSIHPMNILRFDGGGELGKSGQLSIAFEDLNAIVTSELDLLYAGPSPELLHEVDYKTGHKVFTAAMVRESFQFQLHAVLVFHNYPAVNGLEVVIWNTRKNDRTFKVVFKREDLADYTSRVRMAIQTRIQQYDEPETWPTAEKCGICDVASRCPVASKAMRSIDDDPAAFVLDMQAVQSRLEAMEKLAATYVDKSGKDIVAGDVRFGRAKPKTERKSTATLYVVKASIDTQENLPG